ncbi:hypothetical protein P1J78_15490, partial [Psychromarinibacter sp. C21-152]|nr:hypothetical protein [Psychromarinibacter sediminicola]
DPTFASASDPPSSPGDRNNVLPTRLLQQPANPNCSLAHGSLGTALAISGRTDEAISRQEIAIRMNPRDPSIFFRFSGLALAHYQAGRYAEAADWAGKSARRMPRWYFAHFVLAASLVALDRVEDARQAATICREHLPDVSLADLQRMPLRNEEKMACLRVRLKTAGFGIVS